MASIQKIDLVDIDLNSGSIHREWLNHSIGLADNKGNGFGVRVFRDHQAVDLTGVSVQGYFKDPQGTNIAITSGNSVSGNEAYVVLPQACYTYEGQFCLAIKLVGGGVTGTMRIVDGMIDNCNTSSPVAPTSAVPTYQEIIAQYDAMVAATAAANGAIAATYSGSATYKIGDYCIHDGGLYRCTTAITTAEAWNAAHWTATKIGPDVSDLKSALNETNNSIFKVPKTIDFTINANGINTSGYNSTNAARCRTSYITIENSVPYFFKLNSTEFRIVNVWVYGDGAVPLRRLSATYTDFVYYPQTGDVSIRASFCNASDSTQTITEANRATIASAISFYTFTDKTLLIENVPADAKATGEKAFQYRGNLNGANPITTSVNIGTYASQKKADSTGYPDDMNSLAYCIIQYLVITSSTRYFVIYDISNGNTWYYKNDVYVKYALTDYVDTSISASLLVPNTDDISTNVLKGNYSPNGTDVSFESTPYRVIASNGTITTLEESSGNSHYCVSDKINASEGQRFILNLSMAFNNGVICFYNSSDQRLKIVRGNAVPASGDWHHFVNFVSSAPEGTSYIRIGYNDTYSFNVKLLDSYSLITRKFAGKKWAGIGDSLTYPGTLRASKKYYDYIQERTGIGFVNLGVSGTGYMNDYNGAGTFITRVTNIPDDTDIVTIFGSGNDMGYTIGTADDTTNETVMGNVYLTIQEIFTQKPKVLLGIIAPTPWNNYPPYTAGNKMLTFVTELEKLCAKYSIPFLDLYHESNLRPWDATFRQNYYSKDDGNGVHPDENGNKRFTPMIQDFIERILLSN